MRFLVAVLVAVLVAGCGSSPGSSSDSGPRASSGPVVAARGLIEALETGDCPAAQKLVLDPTALECVAVRELKGSLADDRIELSDISYTAGDVVDDSSTVSVDLGNGDAPTVLNVERVDGDWKVSYDTGV